MNGKEVINQTFWLRASEIGNALLKRIERETARLAIDAGAEIDDLFQNLTAEINNDLQDEVEETK